MWVIEVTMEQHRNEMAGETGHPREKPPTNGIITCSTWIVRFAQSADCQIRPVRLLTGRTKGSAHERHVISFPKCRPRRLTSSVVAQRVDSFDWLVRAFPIAFSASKISCTHKEVSDCDDIRNEGGSSMMTSVVMLEYSTGVGVHKPQDNWLQDLMNEPLGFQSAGDEDDLASLRNRTPNHDIRPTPKCRGEIVAYFANCSRTRNQIGVTSQQLVVMPSANQSLQLIIRHKVRSQILAQPIREWVPARQRKRHAITCLYIYLICVSVVQVSADCAGVHRMLQVKIFGRRLLTARSSHPMRVIEVSMEQLRNREAGEAGDPREHPPTNGIARHDSQIRKSAASCDPDFCDGGQGRVEEVRGNDRVICTIADVRRPSWEGVTFSQRQISASRGRNTHTASLSSASVSPAKERNRRGADPRENPPTNGIVQHHSYMRKSGDPAGVRLYSLKRKYADVNCALVTCCYSGRPRLGHRSTGGVIHRVDQWLKIYKYTRTRQQNGFAVRQHVGTPFANRRLVTCLPPGSAASRESFTARNSQSETRPIARASLSYLESVTPTTKQPLRERVKRFGRLLTTSRNETAGETGDPRENPLTSGIIQYNFHLRKSGLNQPGIEAGLRWWEASRLTDQPLRPLETPKWSSTLSAGARKREIPEKIRRPEASSGMTPTCEIREWPGRSFNPICLWCEASRLTAQPRGSSVFLLGQYHAPLKREALSAKEAMQARTYGATPFSRETVRCCQVVSTCGEQSKAYQPATTMLYVERLACQRVIRKN
ncbi:hypothetical protein PR048_013917 [Dryococelus australis]|uniref:Uncharacterized protein n=1 Tax=Dryococelus australis TaxID=614101 RepID=A0ABQ9HTJ7_9NEOP|nr:hypothetical protein PR048_013917 [Dryococelus australis]